MAFFPIVSHFFVKEEKGFNLKEKKKIPFPVSKILFLKTKGKPLYARSFMLFFFLLFFNISVDIYIYLA